MNTTNAAVGTGVIVVLGKWAKDETLDVGIVVGSAVFAVALSILPEPLGDKFALLVLMLAGFIYGPAIGFRAGLVKNKPADWNWQGKRSVVDTKTTRVA